PPDGVGMAASVHTAWFTDYCCRAGAGRGQDALHNLVVAGTPTQIAHHPCFDLGFRRTLGLIEQRGRRDNLAGRADATLKSAIADEGVLQRSEVLGVRRQSLDGDDARDPRSRPFCTDSAAETCCWS